MATHGFNAAEMEARRVLLRDELAALEDQKMKAIGGLQVIDIHHPERSPGWPIYRHQEFPKMLYHPTAKREDVEQRRLGVRRRNESNPNLAPMDIPTSEAVTLKVENAKELAAALAEGWSATPVIYNGPTVDANSPLEMIGRAERNPLPKPAVILSAKTIIELYALPLKELVKEAKEVYGVVLTDEATKLDIVTAIQGGDHGSNAA